MVYLHRVLVYKLVHIQYTHIHIYIPIAHQLELPVRGYERYGPIVLKSGCIYSSI